MVPDINRRHGNYRAVSEYILNPKREVLAAGVSWDEARDMRVGQAVTHNMHTDDVREASAYMSWIDDHRMELREASGGSLAGAPATAGNCYHVTLAWSPDELVTWEEQLAASHDFMAAQGLQDHMYSVVQHIDEPQPHVHIQGCLVHPETGIIHQPWEDRVKAQEWAYQYEKAHGVVCKQRDEKMSAREEKRLEITTIYERSEDAEAFQSDLEERGYTLAQGDAQKWTIVDRAGKVESLSGYIDLGEGTTGPGKSEVLEGYFAELEALPRASVLSHQRQGPRTRDEYREIVTEAFERSDNGASFAAALDNEGLTLAVGNRRAWTFVDERGTVHNVNKYLDLGEDVKRTAVRNALNERLGDLDPVDLEKADTVSDRRKEEFARRLEVPEPVEAVTEEEPAEYDRDQAEIDQQNALLEAADAHAKVSELGQQGEEKAEPEYDRDQQEVDQLNAMLDAAEVHAEAEASQPVEPTPAVRSTRPAHILSEDEKRAEAERQKQVRIAAWERRIEEKTQEARERLQIDELIEAKAEAGRELEEVSGWWSRHVFKRRAYQEAEDHHRDMSLRLQEREARLKAEIEGLNAKRGWEIESELEAHGIDPEVTFPVREEAPSPTAEFDDAAFEEHWKRVEAEREQERAEEIIDETPMEIDPDGGFDEHWQRMQRKRDRDQGLGL